MRIDEIRTLDMPAIETRMAEIKVEMDSEDANLEALNQELDAIEERKASIIAEAEERNKVVEQIINEPVAQPIIVEERKMENVVEVRNTPAYKSAYLEYIKTGNDAECRALLSTNGTSESLTGYVPVPEVLEREIKTAWESNALFDVIRKTFIKGNVKVGFELSATGASIHKEGTAAPDEEVVTLGVIELKAESLKKWITITDEAIDLNDGILDYIYKELAYRIVALAVEEMIGKITSAPTTGSTSTAANVKTIALEPNVDTIVKAVAQLSAQATDLHIVMNRQTKAEFVSKALNANYSVDVFDGLRDRIIFTDALDGYNDADEGEVYAIVGDFGYGAQANFPNGTEMTIKFDNLSLAEKDLVKVVGRMYVALAVVAENAFVTITKPETESE